MEWPRLDHTAQNKKERRKQSDNKMPRKESRRTGLEHPGQNKRQGPPPPGLGHLGTSGCQTPRTGASGTEQGARAPPGQDHQGTSGDRTPRTASSGLGQAARAAAPRTGSSEDKGRPDAPDWNIQGGTGRRSHRTHDTKDQGHVVGRCPGLQHLRQNKKGRPQPPGLGKDGSCPGRINQKGSPPPGLERPGERGGQRRRKQEAETKVVRRERQDRKQCKGPGRGQAGRQRSGRGRGDTGQQR